MKRIVDTAVEAEMNFSVLVFLGRDESLREKMGFDKAYPVLDMGFLGKGVLLLFSNLKAINAGLETDDDFLSFSLLTQEERIQIPWTCVGRVSVETSPSLVWPQPVTEPAQPELFPVRENVRCLTRFREQRQSS